MKPIFPALASTLLLAACASTNQTANNADSRYDQRSRVVATTDATPTNTTSTVTVTTASPAIVVKKSQSHVTPNDSASPIIVNVPDTKESSSNEAITTPVQVETVTEDQPKTTKTVSVQVTTSNEEKVEEQDSSPGWWQSFVQLFTPEHVKPWKKSTLAKATMKPGGLAPDSEKFNEKVHSSKESSRGGNGVAGGGCGCN